MPGLRHPALIKALRTGAFFIWTIVAGAALASGGLVRTKAAIDGDTLAMADGSIVRLIGINAPELGKDGAPDEPFAREARTALAQLVAQRDVRLVFGEEALDHYGRRLAHVLLADGRDVAETLLAKGLACAIAIPPNIARFAGYSRIEAKARSAGLGLWGDTYSRPVPAERLDSVRTGFHFVTGRVRRVSSTRYGYHLWLTDRFALQVPRDDVRFFPQPLSQLQGRVIEARGWVTSRYGKLRMKVQHPGMLRPFGRASATEKTYHSSSPAG